jgi:hypothetical protein
MMQRLVRAPDIIRSHAGGHGLDALSLTRQQQPRKVRFHRSAAISVPCSFRQAIRVMPQSAFLVGLARKNVPQKHSTSVLLFLTQ